MDPLPGYGLYRAPKARYVQDLVRTVAPAEDPVTLSEINDHLKPDDDSQAALIQTYIDAAVQELDGYSGSLGRAIIQQTWQWSLDHGFPAHALKIPLPELISVTSIKYVDVNGVTQTLDPTAYVVLEGPRSAIMPSPGTFWPSTGCQPRAVTITFVAGYGAAADVPKPIKVAIMLMVADMFTNREAVVIGQRAAVVENPTVERLLSPYRVPKI